MRRINAGENNPRYGVKLTEDIKQKISEKRKEAKTWVGENNPNYANPRKGKNHPQYGTHRSEETKRKLSEWNKNHMNIYNEELDICKYIHKDEPIPEGWKKRSQTNKTKKYINNLKTHFIIV